MGWERLVWQDVLDGEGLVCFVEPADALQKGIDVCRGRIGLDNRDVSWRVTAKSESKLASE